MLKRQIQVIYNPELNKKELYFQAKEEIKEIYKSLKNSHLNKKEKEIRVSNRLTICFGRFREKLS